VNNSDTAVLETIRDAIGNAGAGAVFGEAVTRDGITLLPAAKLSGGGGGGSGEGSPAAAGQGRPAEATGHGNGGGFGVSAKPVGAFVITDGAVRWRPAVDLNKVILGSQIVAVAALLTLRAIVRASDRRTHRKQRSGRLARR
jgi:uncharacterized spore protein YtfJ